MCNPSLLEVTDLIFLCLNGIIKSENKSLEDYDLELDHLQEQYFSGENESNYIVIYPTFSFTWSFIKSSYVFVHVTKRITFRSSPIMGKILPKHLHILITSYCVYVMPREN